MGGIQLDWQVEADHKADKKATEDAGLARARHIVLLRLLLVIIIFLTVVGLIVALVSARLEQVNQRMEQLLEDSIQAEVAALRIGDREGYMAMQRSASEAWLATQNERFGAYQQLKLTSDLQLGAQIKSLTLDGQRARAVVEEIIDGVPYVQVWFYWRYEEGWYHVPPDYTFWGAEQTLAYDRFSVRYRNTDQPFAVALADQVDRWLETACALINCESLPPLTFDVVTDTLEEPVWVSQETAWQMVLKSPYTGRARGDQPFSFDHRVQTATLLAEQLISHATNQMVPAYPSDSYFLRRAIHSWLVGQFVQVDTESQLITSLAAQYGSPAVGQLLTSLQAESDMSVITGITGVTPGSAGLDWRDFLTWRLKTEDDLINRQEESHWLALIDTRDETARQAAYARYSAGAVVTALKTVISVTHSSAPDGAPQLQAAVRTEAEGSVSDAVVTFNLVDGIWRRAG